MRKEEERRDVRSRGGNLENKAGHLSLSRIGEKKCDEAFNSIFFVYKTK